LITKGQSYKQQARPKDYTK